MKHIFIIGSKGIPAKYGGFETFVEQLTTRRLSDDVQYHVSCLSDDTGEVLYNKTRCFHVKVPHIGSARAVLYDLLSIRECIKYIEKYQLHNSIVYILACRIGPFFHAYKRKLNKLGVQVFVNPDGHEWKRGKWNRWIKRYWKVSEKLMVKHADLLVCDSKGIEQYIRNDYSKYKPNTTFIAYGADISKSVLNNNADELIQWMERFQVYPNEYYLVIGRFVPENNYELMITEFMKTETKKNLVIITNAEQNTFYDDLLTRTRLDRDHRIKFVGTVYNQQLLKKIRELAYGYIHGHEVGGTNPSLLESLASTRLNLLLDVIFNQEVAEDGAVYFSKDKGSLASLIHEADRYDEDKINRLEHAAKERIIYEYAWENIIQSYEGLFLREEGIEMESGRVIGWRRNTKVMMNRNQL